MKKNHLLFTWEKYGFKTKDMYHEVLNIVCLETFSEKRKENELHRNYTLFGGPAQNLSSPTISEI